MINKQLINTLCNNVFLIVEKVKNDIKNETKSDEIVKLAKPVILLLKDANEFINCYIDNVTNNDRYNHKDGGYIQNLDECTLVQLTRSKDDLEYVVAYLSTGGVLKYGVEELFKDWASAFVSSGYDNNKLTKND